MSTFSYYLLCFLGTVHGVVRCRWGVAGGGDVVGGGRGLPA